MIRFGLFEIAILKFKFLLIYIILLKKIIQIMIIHEKMQIKELEIFEILHHTRIYKEKS